MGAQAHLLLQLSTSFNSSSLNPNDRVNQTSVVKFSRNTIRCCSTRSHSKGETNYDGGRSRFSFDDELKADGGGDVDDFFAKQRKWWSDYDYEDEDDWEVDEDDDFSILKILRSFGWMVPAIAMSLLMGTGTNTFLMALAVPLGQSMLSLALDKVWGRTGARRKSRSRTKNKRRPYAKAASDFKTRQGKQGNEASRGKESYQSWVAADGGSYEKGGRSGPRFGGWDELDREARNQKSARGGWSRMRSESPKQQKKTKLSRMGRTKERPLFLRLLIAVFPFLGSWTRLLF